MRIWKTDADGNPGPWVSEVVGALADGGVVVLPTDTFYGLAADSRSDAGLARVLELKGRAPNHPLLLLVHDYDAVRRLAPSADTRLEDLAGSFWPGPLTVVLRADGNLAAPLVGPTGGVAVRVPNAAVPREVARLLGAPITGTSANRTGAPAAIEPADIALHSKLLSGVIDGGAAPGGAASTLVDLTGPVARIVRAGAIPRQAVRRSLNGRLL